MNVTKNNLQFKQLTPKVSYLQHHKETDRPILGVVKGSKGTLLVDSGNSKNHAQLLLKKVKENGFINLTHLFFTHFHWDHIFGAKTIGISPICTDKTAIMISKMARYDWTLAFAKKWNREGKLTDFALHGFLEENEEIFKEDIVIPTKTFKNQKTIALGGVTCKLVYVGGQHSHDSAVCYVVEEKVLFCGDCLYANMHSNDFIYNLKELKNTLKKLNRFDAEYYVLSHQEVMTKKEFIQLTFNMLKIGELVANFKFDTSKITSAFEKAKKTKMNEDLKPVVGFFQNDKK